MYIYAPLASSRPHSGNDNHMKSSCTVYIATSTDGFIAQKDGGIDWLHNPDYVLEGEDFGFAAFMDSIDALLMGRTTYEQVLTFGDWPYTKPVYVATSRELEFPEFLQGKVFKISGEPQEILAELRWNMVNRIYIDGGNTIQRFLKAGLIDRMIITRIPILIGEGIPLFGPTGSDITLKLLSCQSFDNGFVQLEYAPVYPET